MLTHAIPEALVRAITEGRAALIVGPGITSPFWGPFWPQFMDRMFDRLIDQLTAPGQDSGNGSGSGSDSGDGDAVAREVTELVTRGDTLRAAAFVVRTLGTEVAAEVLAALTTEIGLALGSDTRNPDPPARISAAHMLARIPARQIWTSCPGDWLHVVASCEQPDSWPTLARVELEPDAEIPPDERALVELFGSSPQALASCLREPRLAREQLGQARALDRALRALYSQGTLVLVGFGPGDPDLHLFLDQILGSYDRPEGPHYWIASGVDPVLASELHHAHRIEVVDVGRTAGPEHAGSHEAGPTALASYLHALSLASGKASVSLVDLQPLPDDLGGWLALWPRQTDEAREAVAAIARAARQDHDPERLAEVLVGWVDHEDRVPERARLLRELGYIFEHQIGDLGKAHIALGAALRDDPGHLDTLDEAERVAEAIEQQAELGETLAEVASALEDSEPALAALYWLRLGRLHEQHTQDRELAAAAYQRAARDPDQAGPACTALAALAALYRASERFTELAEVLARHAELEDEPARRIALYLALGEVSEDQLDATQQAVAAYRAALDLDGHSEAALAALERLYRRDERWTRLAEILATKARVVTAVNAQRGAAIHRELGRLRITKLGDQAGAIADYEAAFALDADDAGSLRALAELYGARGRVEDYLRAIELLADFLPEEEQAMALLQLAADVESRDPQKALWCYERVAALEGASQAAHDAYRALVRLRRDARAWHELAQVLTRYIAIAPDDATRLSLYGELAALYDQELGDPHRAIEQYLHARAIEPWDRQLALALARLFGRIEAWERAALMLITQADHDADAELWYEAGKLLAGHAEDIGSLAAIPAPDALAGPEPVDPGILAERCLEHALVIEPGHGEAMLALARLYQDQGRLASAAEYLIRAEEHAPSRSERVSLLIAAAELFESRLGEPERSLDLCLRVLEIDPDNDRIALITGEKLAQAGRYDEAIPILDLLMKRSSGPDRPELTTRIERELGRIHGELGQHEQAVARYRRVLAVHPDDRDTLLLLAHAQRDEAEAAAIDMPADQRQALWLEAEAAYRDYVERYGAVSSAQDVVDAWYRRGQTAAAAGARDRAEAAYRQALERDPIHRPSLIGLVEVAAGRGDWHTVIECKRIQIEATLSKAEYDGEPRLRLLSEIGEIHHRELRDAASALAAYQEALDIAPRSQVLLHKALDIHVEKGDYRQAVATLRVLADSEELTWQRARYCYTAARIARDELGDEDLAIAELTRALDANPASQRALRAIDKLYSQRGDYRGLVRVYRGVLGRIGDQAALDALLPLWDRLGEICRDYLCDREAALAALEVAASLDPDNLSRHEELVELYRAAGPARRDDGIAALHVLVAHEPQRIELLYSLSELYSAAGKVDEAYCLARTLVFLDAAGPDEAALARRHRRDRPDPQGRMAARRPLDEELWQSGLVHPDENTMLSALFSALCGPLTALTARPVSAFGPTLDGAGASNGSSRPHTGHANGVPAAVTHRFAEVAEVLSLDPRPILYVRDDLSDVRVVNTRDSGQILPSVLLGRSLAEKAGDAELTFLLAKRLAYLRPDRYVHCTLATLPRLKTAYAAALLAAGVATPEAIATSLDRAHGQDARDWAERLRVTVAQDVLDRIAVMTGELGLDVLESGALATWHAAADLTANRVALLLCDDIDTAARLIAAEPESNEASPLEARVRELVAYSVSEPYFALRRHLGLHVTGPARVSDRDAGSATGSNAGRPE